MSRKIERISDYRPVSEGRRRRLQEDGDANRLASLARLTFNRQKVFSLPNLSAVPTVFSGNPAKDTSVIMAETFINADLGSMELWRKADGNVHIFLDSALNKWVADRGGKELSRYARFSLDITTNVPGCDLGSYGALVSIESGNSGLCLIGNGLHALESYRAGLARDFYNVLTSSIYRWTFAYTYADAEETVERWIEGTEFPEQLEGETFEQLCKRAGVSFPEVKKFVPDFLKDKRGGKWEPDCSAERLKTLLSKDASFRRTELGSVVENVLKMYEQERVTEIPEREDVDSIWDDNMPLPGWLIAFERADGVCQCFDEEGRSLLEMTHAPSWYTTFDASSVEQFQKVLTDIQSFIRCNNALERIANTFSAMEKSNAKQRPSRRAA